MMIAADIRECNRLEKNAKRLAKARELVEMVIKTNELSDLDLNLVSSKLEKASAALTAMRTRIMKNRDAGTYS